MTNTHRPLPSPQPQARHFQPASSSVVVSSSPSSTAQQSLLSQRRSPPSRTTSTPLDARSRSTTPHSFSSDHRDVAVHDVTTTGYTTYATNDHSTRNHPATRSSSSSHRRHSDNQYDSPHYSPDTSWKAVAPAAAVTHGRSHPTRLAERYASDDVDEREDARMPGGALWTRTTTTSDAVHPDEGTSWDALLMESSSHHEPPSRQHARSVLMMGRRRSSRSQSLLSSSSSARSTSSGEVTTSMYNNNNNRPDVSSQSEGGTAHFLRRPDSVRARAQSLEGGRRSALHSTTIVRNHRTSAVVLLQQQQQQSLAPPSPVQSSGSSAYVGWPGTQDANGKTVTASSYDDSSTAGPISKEAAEQQQEISHWTAQTSAMTSEPDETTLLSHHLDMNDESSPFPSPIRKNNNNSLDATMDLAPINFHPQSAAEFHLAAALADAQARSEALDSNNNNNNSRLPQSDASLSRAIPFSRSIKGSSSSSLHMHTASRRHSPLGGDQNISPGGSRATTQHHQFSKDFSEWDTVETTSSPAAASKSSSAYLKDVESSKMNVLEYPDLSVTPPQQQRQRSSGPVDLDDPPTDDDDGDDDERRPADSFRTPTDSIQQRRSAAYRPFHDRHQKEAAAAAANVLRRHTNVKPQPQQQQQQQQQQPPITEAALERNNRQYRNFATPTAKGFRGLLDKTKEVPSLMDGLDSDSMASSKATSVSGTSSALPQQAQNGKNHRDFLRHLYDVDGDTSSDVFDGLSVTKESDVFDNLSFVGSETRLARMAQRYHRSAYHPERIAEEDDNHLNTSGGSASHAATEDGFSVVMLGGGLATIQTAPEDYQMRRTASSDDGHMTSSSDVSSTAFDQIPGYQEMLSAGTGGDSSLHGIHGNIGKPRQPRNVNSRTAAAAARSASKAQHPSPWTATPAMRQQHQQATSGSDSVASESSSTNDDASFFSDPYRSDSGLDVEGDLSEYYIHPSVMKKVLRKFRQFSENDSKLGFAEYERAEDDRKVYALFEMRSRIMEKDIERGLERRGGTTVVDDLVLTPYYRTAHRVRDAVIVSKAWRDGATISDVVKSALLTRRPEQSFFIRRPVQVKEHVGIGGRYRRPSVQRYTWEARKWVDDADFMQYRCPSLGSRQMWGFQIFTIGDCQSMLLKLTNERCMELRGELNAAMVRQIDAEDALSREKGDDDGMMTEAEMTYLSAMEEVKTISKKFVRAEQAFSLVRERIQNLISRYHAMLLKIETRSFAVASSVGTYESSYASAYGSSVFWNEQEQLWARRARRAEVKAELSAREAALAKQQGLHSMKEEKLQEIAVLQRKLDELQSVGSSPVEEKAVAATKLTVQRASAPSNRENAPSLIQSTTCLSKQKVDDVKQRFRDRMAARKRQDQQQQQQLLMNANQAYHSGHSQRSAPRRTQKSQAERELIMSAGEEMCQQLDFYERSLKAVDTARAF